MKVFSEIPKNLPNTPLLDSINIPEDIGHGMKINKNALEKYKVDVEIFINKEKHYER